MKALPYGISDFPRVMREDYYYVDKTRFIEMLERQPPYLFLIRPRRFGKSLFLAMLEAYYSIDYADRFGELFGELYIGQHPTERHNRYMVLRFNFSEVSSKLETVERSFSEYCCMVMKNFMNTTTSPTPSFLPTGKNAIGRKHMVTGSSADSLIT